MFVKEKSLKKQLALMFDWCTAKHCGLLNENERGQKKKCSSLFWWTTSSLGQSGPHHLWMSSINLSRDSLRCSQMAFYCLRKRQASLWSSANPCTLFPPLVSGCFELQEEEEKRKHQTPGWAYFQDVSDLELLKNRSLGNKKGMS